MRAYLEVEMPESCDECILQHSATMVLPWCGFSGRFCDKPGRLEDCPLKSVEEGEK